MSKRAKNAKERARKKGLTQIELQSQLQQFKEQRGSEFDLTALGYFGSYTRREAHPESDIDIVFATSHPSLWMTLIIKQ